MLLKRLENILIDIISMNRVYTIRLMKEAASEGYSKAINYLQIRCSI